jgi:DNA-binding NarL/FixJ family response regulator
MTVSSPVRLLVVDDCAEMRESILAILARVSNVELAGEVGSAHEAMDVIREVAVDIVLMDIRMPEMNGLEATRHMLASPNAPRIVLFTFDEPQVYEEAALAAGAHGFLRKSELWTELVPMLRSLESRRSI